MAFGLFKRKNKEEKADNRYQTLTIREVVPIAKEAVNLVFEKPTKPFNYKPGQFITLIQTIGGEKVRRAYSLCTTPFEDEFPAVTVKRVPGGLMSNYANDHFRAGDEVEVMEPMGMFTTEYSADRQRQVVLFGGGSGITPLYSILRSILLKEPNSKVALVYGNRSEEYVIFHKELEALKEQYMPRFDVIHILEDDPNGLTFYHGRPTMEMIGELTDFLKVTPETEFFICGPEPMMNITLNGLKQVGIKEAKIRKESFDAGKTLPKEAVNGATKKGATSEVTIVLEGEEHVLQIASDTSVLDAGLANGLDMPYSCQSGLCTACRGKCVEGEISLDDAEGLSQSELDEGYVLLCIGKPKTDKVRVEVG